MARLTGSGIDELNEAFEKAGNIPQQTITEMLKAMGTEVQRAIKSSAGRHSVPFGPMLASLYSKKPKLNHDGGNVITTFRGGRTRGRTYTREAEIAFITNYGKRGEPARQFVTDVTESPDPSIAAAGEKVLDTYLEKVGL